MDSAERWRADLAAWAIPDSILAGAGASPWTLPRGVFARRAERQVEAPDGPSFARAAEALPAGGTVLDVGAGAGAASLPLARRGDGGDAGPGDGGGGRAGAIVAVDEDADLLATFADLAGRIGVPARTVTGRWPDVAATVDPADVVVCHHVLYNVPDIAAFATALTGHARRRVVVELTARHPLTVLNPLWQRLHGLDRPERPTAADAVAVLRDLGLDPLVRHWQRPARAEYASVDDLVAHTARRLCLPPGRHAEVRAALDELGADRWLGPPVRDLVTIWWDP
jgi:SAM-dependent methyltransferase